MSSTAKAIRNQAYDWFITITGVKSEELGFLGESGAEFLSVCGNWPKKTVEVAGDKIEMPDIMIK